MQTSIFKTNKLTNKDFTTLLHNFDKQTSQVIQHFAKLCNEKIYIFTKLRNFRKLYSSFATLYKITTLHNFYNIAQHFAQLYTTLYNFNKTCI